MFKKDELAARPQDSSYTSNDLHCARDRAQREGAHNRIDATVPPRECVRQGGLETHCPASFGVVAVLPAGSSPGWVRAHRPCSPSRDRSEGNLRQGYADLENFALGQRNEPLSNFPDGPRVAQRAYEMGVNVISIGGHSCLPQWSTAQLPFLLYSKYAPAPGSVIVD